MACGTCCCALAVARVRNTHTVASTVLCFVIIIAVFKWLIASQIQQVPQKFGWREKFFQMTLGESKMWQVSTICRLSRKRTITLDGAQRLGNSVVLTLMPSSTETLPHVMTSLTITRLLISCNSITH